MSDPIPFELRIYCLCGQKMKVSSDMLGKPGKCIACRQKIRIPSDSELGPDDVVIHLKDHPEFLRKPGRSTAALPDVLEGSPSDLDRDDVLLEGESGQLAAVAFVRCEPIRRLCNYEYKIRMQLQCIREGRPAELDKATLMSYRGLARQSRQQLEGRIRDQLIAISAELQDIRVTISEQHTALELGETEHIAYSKAVLPLRKRREMLIYRQQNFRGWLATEDPHAAGGLEDVVLSDVPLDLSEGPFPLEDEILGLPIEHAVTHLEKALRDRERADNLISELHRTSLSGENTVVELAHRKKDAEAERQRARTAVAFYRGRLEQIIQDCEEDSSALKSYEEVMRESLKIADISSGGLKKLEETIFRAQVDVKRARNMANRALNANAVSDVPNPHGTFLERLARPGGMRGLGIDSGLAWASSILLLIKLLLSVVMQVPDGLAPAIQGNSVQIFVLAALVSLSATITIRSLRGALFNLLWLLLTLVGAFYLAQSLSPAGAPVEASPTVAWLQSIDGLLSLGSWLLLGGAALFSFYAMGGLRWGAIVNVVFGIVAAGVLLAGGLRSPEQPVPVLGEPTFLLIPEEGTYSVLLLVENTGDRSFRLGGEDDDAPDVAAFILEYKVGTQSWADAGPPLGVIDSLRNESPFPAVAGLTIAPGERVELRFNLSPGIYRSQLIPAWDDVLPVRKTFQLPVPKPEELRAATPVPETVVPSLPPALPSIGIELRGVLDGVNTDPIFSVIIHESDGTLRKEQYRLGDKIYGDWEISEFSPSHNTMTVINGDRLLIVERGKLERLD